MRLSDFVHTIKNHLDFGPAFVHYHYIPATQPRYVEFPDLDPSVLHVLEKFNINRFYSHQNEALRHIGKGENVLVATPTASGKSLIYNIAVIETLLRDEKQKALYIFPLKALEQDQMKNLSCFIDGINKQKISARIYDGDTSPYNRKKMRHNPPEILFTNPDMLHLGIMAYHEKWDKLFKNLSYVILDEVHTYRGIFGSHMNQIIKRLKRICAIYSRNPRFILLSATINNPLEFGESLIQEKIRVVESNGSPRSGQHFLFLNPEISPNFSAAKLFAHCISHGFRTIAFTQSRKVTELIHIWVSQLSPQVRGKISSYRAGFMPEERREIEKKLARGELLGVISTSALEMGIDIGFLDICLLVGYPGTIINTWQRGGRVGRGGNDSMVILIAKPDALDQYFIKHPDELFTRSYESAILDPHNPYVVRAHLPCAADESPLTIEDEKYWSRDLKIHLDTLEAEGELTKTADGRPEYFPVRSRPHLLVNIRSTGESYTIFERETGQAIGSIDGLRAFKECHPGAVYLHRARQYLVDRLDLEKSDIIVHESDLKYFTRARSEKDTEIIKVTRSKPEGQFIVREGILRVTEQVTGYEKRALPGQELMGVFPLQLPERTFETVGFWVEIEPIINHAVEKEKLHLMGGIHAIEHASIGLFPIFVLCDRNDIGGICFPYHPQVEKSVIFIYDGYPGGVGLAQKGFEVVKDLFEKTLDHLNECECDEGCPSCIHSPKCGSGNKPLDKKAAILILKMLLGHIPFSQSNEEHAVQDHDDTLIKPEPVKKPGEPRIIYLDLETQKLAQDVGGWNNSHLMRVSVAVIYDSVRECFLSYTEDMVDDLVRHLRKADLVVGFNIKRFDYAVLGAYTSENLGDLPTFDILEDVYGRLGFRLGLDHLAKETINKGKSADGLQAVEWFRHGEMTMLTEYCRNDVETTRDLFQYGVNNGYLVYRGKKNNRRLRLPVDWNLEALIKRGRTAGG
ncbi:MAG: DEAD/DEAH box helicase [Deltaproteobacteria bacterium]|nr:DEAD/DEAH box helicase [Deltaproteobacteria bacterium]